jgi:hypothetical protein
VLLKHNKGTPEPLWVTVVVPPKGNNKHAIEAFVDLDDALNRARELPEGTRYSSMRVQGDVLAAITPELKKRKSQS